MDRLAGQIARLRSDEKTHRGGDVLRPATPTEQRSAGLAMLRLSGVARWVSMRRGATRLTVISRRASSTASALARPSRQALAVTTCALSLHPKLERHLAKALGKAGLKTLFELLRAFRSVESKPEIR